MKNTRNLFLTVAVCLSALVLRAAAPDPQVDFVGYSTTKSETLFLLKEVSSGQVSGWMSEGQAFRGYKIEKFDAKEETLKIKTPGGPLLVRLQDGKVRHGNADAIVQSRTTVTMSGALRNPIKIDANNLSTLADAIAAAGGLADSANASAVKVNRLAPDGKLRTYSVDASPEAKGPRSAKAFTLRPEDMIFVSTKKPDSSAAAEKR